MCIQKRVSHTLLFILELTGAEVQYIIKVKIHTTL